MTEINKWINFRKEQKERNTIVSSNIQELVCLSCNRPADTLGHYLEDVVFDVTV
jgi:hypothetical protein